MIIRAEQKSELESRQNIEIGVIAQSFIIVKDFDPLEKREKSRYTCFMYVDLLL